MCVIYYVIICIEIRKLVNNMNDKELLKMNKQELIDELKNIQSEIDGTDFSDGHYYGILRAITLVEKLDDNTNTTPTHYQGSIQPIDLINAQNLNFNLGNVVKYVCRAGKKQGENILSDLEKAKNYINYEIERIKKNE